MPAFNVISAIFIISFLSIVAYYMWVPSAGTPNLVDMNINKTSNRWFFVIAGNLNQASNITKHLLPAFRDSNVIAADFSNRGYNVYEFISEITARIKSLPHNSEVSIVTMSLGIQPAITLSNTLDIPVYALNPCLSDSSLLPRWRIACWATYLIGGVFVSAIGAFSFLPFIGYLSKIPNHQNYSLATLFEQYANIITHRPTDPGLKNIRVVILSEQDSILDNAKVRRQFMGCQFTYINTTHGDTANSADQYILALKEAFAQNQSQKRRH